jgi:hypothetical protein
MRHISWTHSHHAMSFVCSVINTPTKPTERRHFTGELFTFGAVQPPSAANFYTRKVYAVDYITPRHTKWTSKQSVPPTKKKPSRQKERSAHTRHTDHIHTVSNIIKNTGALQNVACKRLWLCA